MEIKSGGWVNNNGNGAFGVTGQLTKRCPSAVLQAVERFYILLWF